MKPGAGPQSLPLGSRLYLRLLLVCLLLAFDSDPLSARTFEIRPGKDRIRSLLPHLSAGDTILLAESGVYSENTGVTLPAFPLTILASGGLDTRPVLRTGGSFQLLIQSDILLRSISFDGEGETENALQSAASVPNTLIASYWATLWWCTTAKT